MEKFTQHFCITNYIFNQSGEKVLLHKHKKLGLYFAPGGHIDENEDYISAAKREVYEEFGIEDITHEEFINKKQFGIIQPYAIQKNILPNNHIHFDIILNSVLDENIQIKPGAGESKDIEWFDVSNIDSCKTTEEVKFIVKDVSAKIIHYRKMEKIQNDVYMYPIYNKSLKDDLSYFIEGHDFGTWNLGNIYDELPKKYANKMGADFGIFTSTGTAGMHAAMIACGLLPGDEVIVPSMTFIRAASPLTHLQLQPIIADIDAETGNIDPESIKQNITPKTKAVVVVHMWGVPADCEKIRKICDENNLIMIEDFSHAHFSRYKDRFVGSYGDASFCSMQRKKTLSVGEGGLVVTSNAEIFERLKEITSPGSFVDRSDYSKIDFSGFGLNMRMSPFSAVVANNIFPEIDNIIMKRRDNLKTLTEIISDNTNKISLPDIPEYTSFENISWYSYKPTLNGIELSDLKKLNLWKFGAMGYSPIKTHQYWDKNTSFFPFNFGIKPLIRHELVGHDKYINNRISLSITFANKSYWTEEVKQHWANELKKL